MSAAICRRTSVSTAAAAFARAARAHSNVAFVLDGLGAVPPAVAAQAVVEGVLLARYSYDALRREPKGAPVAELTLVTGSEATEVTAGAAAGRAYGAAIEVFDKDALIEMGCGGLLGVNAGSAEPPRMIKLTYRPKGRSRGRLVLVGKGIMYDAGGIALKPGDEVHAQMKNDMSGAAAILAAMYELAELGCTSTVTGYLMCTDNMPSGTAMALGDVITIRDGTTPTEGSLGRPSSSSVP